MKQKCIRCVVQLSLAELLWQDDNEVDIHLEGPALFVRACILGQLQHSRLHKPVFPVKLDQELTFDRVLTNCKHPSLFNEVIRGEHIKIEIIQVSPDYTCGKILARFESPAHKFLFPDNAPPTGELQHVLLNKSRKYEHPPLLTFTCSTTLLETTVQSPVDVIFNESRLETTHNDNDEDTASSTSELESPPSPPRGSHHGRLTLSALGGSTQHPSSATRSSTTASRRLFQHSSPSTSLNRSHAPPPRYLYDDGETCLRGSVGDRPSTQERLHSLLEPYSTPTAPAGGMGMEHGHTDTKPVYRVKFKPPVPRFSRTDPYSGTTSTLVSSGTKADYEAHETLGHTSPDGSLYESLTKGLGHHEWEVCPRRSPNRPRSHSAPCSPIPSSKLSPAHVKSSTIPNQIPMETFDKFHLEHTDPTLTPSHTSAPDLRPPFVVRHADPSLLEKRNFCGESCSSNTATTKHHDRGDTTEVENESGGNLEGHFEVGRDGLKPKQDGGTSSCIYDHHSTSPMTFGHTHGTSSPVREPLHGHSKSLPPKSPLKSSIRNSSTGTHHRHAVRCRCSSSKSAPTSPYKSQHRHYSTTSSSVPAHGGGQSSLKYTFGDPVVAKYLVSRPGNTRPGVDSPGAMIQDKLERLRQECCKCLRSADSLGEDDLSEDLERLRASLEAERRDTLNRSAKLLPDQSVTVKIGPRDYWSERMAEYTGKRHRIIFDETLEKIYNRLYTNASQSH